MAEALIKVLLIEDDADDYLIAQDLFSEIEGKPYELECVNTLASAHKRLSAGGIDVILLDLYLPDSVGLATFDQVKNSAIGVPIIVLSGLDNQTIAEAAVEKGARAYLTKPYGHSTNLARAIKKALAI